MSDDAVVGALAGILLAGKFAENSEPEKSDSMTLDEAKAQRERALTEAKIAFDRDLANSKTSADCDEALALWKSRADEAQARFFRAARRSE